MVKLVVNLNCPSCGGALSIEEGESLIFCPYCNTACTTGSNEREKTFLYQSAGSREEIIGKVRTWFTQGSLFQKKASDLKDTGVITESEMIYLPFWRMTGQGRAIVCGYNKEQVDNKTTLDYKESDISRTYDWNEIACNAGEIGVKNITVPDGGVKPVDEEEIPVFDTNESIGDGMERGATGIRDMVFADASSGISNITFAKAFVTPDSFCKILYPFWIVRYSYQNRGYFAVVDGHTKEVCSGRAPGDVSRQINSGSIGATITGIIGGLSIFYLLTVIPEFERSVGELVIVPFIILLILGMIIGGMSYQTFRYGSEITEGMLPGSKK